MGSWRFFLAYCVLYTHAFGRVSGFSIGVTAVISFFVMSGYVMALLLNRYYQGPKAIAAFYVDRAARLFPQYLFYVILTLVLSPVFGLPHAYLSNRGLSDIILNVLMLPVGYYMFGVVHQIYVPPAWTLGLEATFYLVFPFFWLLPKRWKYIPIGGSILVFTAAFFGFINTDWYGYRLLLGTFFIFAAGAALADPKAISRNFPKVVMTLSGVAALVTFYSPRLFAFRYNMEVTTGAVIGVGAVTLLRNFRFSAVDEFLGNLSYGVFLNHFLLIFIADRFRINYCLFVPVGSVALSVISYKLVERPALNWRRRLRHVQENPAAELAIEAVR
jgi:peptidoglycan/LPS O-acetylase OafA/YrhL